ncbi:MAG: pyruvate, water dikinase [Deltaproteobacteria bacterium]|nr:pyruvate, water dikinase [Deltaproteobacteria bacterium]
MERMVNILKSFFSRKRVGESSNVEELRTAFKARYHQFKLLLNANNKALDIMAEMEKALKGAHPFGMTFVLSRCTSISTSVWQIIKHLNDLAPGRYEELYERFKEIREKIDPLVQPKHLSGEGPLVIPLHDVDRDMVDQVGGKIANLGEIRNRIHLTVSNGFVITSQAYQRFMTYNDLQAEIDRRIQAANADRIDQLHSLSSHIQQLIIRSPFPEDLVEAISEQYRALEQDYGKGVRVAVRSSALGEDLAGTSFAGQYRSELNVSGENIFHAYKEVVASKYGLPAMIYRLNRGIRDEDVAMCVGCLSMVEAVSGGVVYSRNPVNIRDNAIVLNSVWGLPKSVVDGSMSPDLFIISRKDPMVIIEKEIPVKEQKLVPYTDEGIGRIDLSGEERDMASLTDKQALELARLALEVEDYYGVPQDIEWAIDTKGSVIILQCRPLKQAGTHEVQDINMAMEEGADSIILRGGVSASPGTAAGPVFIVKKDMDALQFPDGAVLVTAQSLPRWATLLNRAAAVVTEQGSIAGHLANVAREYEVPSIFGLKGAMSRLRNGQFITVDADALRIYEGRMEALLRSEETPKNLMEGSPVFDALKGASQHIIPLNLLDPDALSFKPKNCSTFHDITRFCHEKSVHEMFQFGKEHHFPERSSKQLVCEVPMQWWVLNLDDGFKEEVESKYVPLENIVSIPMLALWEGITSFPWEGPPPVDGKGFMSVMFEATRNTALVPGVRSSYADRNYFMISKNYCSLQSRLGFHLSIIETLVSERSGENYISFQFKGGAADDHRRHRRILFITDILEEYGFRVEVKEDHLIARMEDRVKDFMEKSLKILGYLTIHTRQLDMIMSNDTSVNYYRSKIKKDVREMVGDFDVI